jgi:DNA-damage-inducible protein D
MANDKELGGPVPETFIRALDESRGQSRAGTGFWRARDLQVILGYERWDRFKELIGRAQAACESTGVNPDNHFRRTGKMVPLGSGSQREVEDYFLSRFACYLIAMNGDPSKEQIGYAQVYFAIQTRRQERADQVEENEKRIEARQRIRGANKALTSTAKKAGVRRFGLFNDAGYRGLYGGRSYAQIKEEKGLRSQDNLLDYAGRTELAANEFRITQAEDRLRKDRVMGEESAINTHHAVGKEVRAAIGRIGNPMPEELAIETHIRMVETRVRRAKRLVPPAQDS